MFSVAYLNKLRKAELARIMRHFPPGARVLELGAGTGVQALELSRRGFEVAAIDIESSRYVADQVFPVQSYAGQRIPFPDRSFDVVFSSNVLEHVADLGSLHSEATRVLRSGGLCVHAMPTHTWKIWTALTAYPDAVVCGFAFLLGRLSFRQAAGRIYEQVFRMRRHGERGNTFSELWLFRPAWWRAHFNAHGFAIEREEPIGLLYTGHLLFGELLGLDTRARLAQVMGSSAHIFVVRPRAPAQG